MFKQLAVEQNRQQIWASMLSIQCIWGIFWPLDLILELLSALAIFFRKYDYATSSTIMILPTELPIDVAFGSLNKVTGWIFEIFAGLHQLLQTH